MKRTVAALLDIEIDEATNLEFKIAVTRAPGVELLETMSFVHDGNPLEPRRSPPNTVPGSTYSTVPQTN